MTATTDWEMNVGD